MSITPHWTEQETEYLREHWGGRGGIPGIARRLGRSVNAVKVKAQKLHLGPYLDAGAMVSINALHAMVNSNVKSYSYIVGRWRRAGLPVHRVRVENTRWQMVAIEEFWPWAEQHKELFDFSRLDENALGPEPDWVKRKREIDTRNRQLVHSHKCKWSVDEVARLRWLTENGATYEEIERDLRRSTSAIRRKIYDLYLPRPKRMPCCKYTDEERMELVRLIEQGYSIEYCGKAIGRTGNSVRAEIEGMKRRNEWDRYRRCEG